MFTWKKLGKVFTPQDVPDRPWMAEFAQAPAALVLDDVVRVDSHADHPGTNTVNTSATPLGLTWIGRDMRQVVRIRGAPHPRALATPSAPSTSSAHTQCPSSGSAIRWLATTVAGRDARLSRTRSRSAWRSEH